MEAGSEGVRVTPPPPTKVLVVNAAHLRSGQRSLYDLPGVEFQDVARADILAIAEADGSHTILKDRNNDAHLHLCNMFPGPDEPEPDEYLNNLIDAAVTLIEEGRPGDRGADLTWVRAQDYMALCVAVERYLDEHGRAGLVKDPVKRVHALDREPEPDESEADKTRRQLNDAIDAAMAIHLDLMRGLRESLKLTDPEREHSAEGTDHPPGHLEARFKEARHEQ